MTTDASNEAAFCELDESIHALAQPLTALTFAIEMAYLQSATEEVRQSLLAMRTECRRAVEMLERVRDSATRAREEGTGCPRL